MFFPMAENTSISKNDALEILDLQGDSLNKLIEEAYRLRTKYKGNRVNIQLLTNVRSGNCTQNCAYCAQSRDSEAPIEKYRYVEDKKLYGDNDMVKPRRTYSQNEKERDADMLFHRILDRASSANSERCGA